MKKTNKLLALANDSFLKSDYSHALQYFADALYKDPASKEAYNGAILSEMALSGEEGAEAIFDYYLLLKENNHEEADTIISDILNNLDKTVGALNTLFAEPIHNKLEQEDGILYEDFMKLVKENGNFKETFENIMFSTKIIITKKADFVDFLDKLLTYGFKEMALSYLEGALALYSNDKELRALLKKFGKVRKT
jgi:tetratricopeptide (TPR) repeat protein